MFEQLKCNIGDVDYIINPFKGKQGLKLQVKLAKVVRPALDSIKGLSDESSQLEVIGEMVGSILNQVDEDEILTLIEELLAGVYKGSIKIDLDKELVCNYSLVYHLLKEVIMFNFKDVFSTLGIGSSE
jgi:type IV secretory pathway VirB4 component